MLPFAPYLLGLVTAPLVAKLAKPVLRSTVKATIEIGLQARKIAAEAVEDLQDLAAEATAEMAAGEMAAGASSPRSRVHMADSNSSVPDQKKS